MQVQAQTVSGNIDAPEGGFDGLLQAIVCTRLIGWRALSRKLLLYISDERFHIANDGKVHIPISFHSTMNIHYFL